MINILFKVYIILIPFQVYAKFSGVTLLRVLVLLFILIFVAYVSGRLKVDRQAMKLGFAFLSAPVAFMIFDVFIHEKSIIIQIYLPLLLNIILFITIINFRRVIDFDSAISILAFVCIVTTLLHFTPFVQVGDDGRITTLKLNHNYSALIILTAFIILTSKLRLVNGNPIDLRNILILSASLICIYAITKNGTRFAFLACLLQLGFIYFICLKEKRFVWLLSLSAVALAGFVYLILSNSILIERFRNLPLEFSQDGRLLLWLFALQSVGENFFFGIGTGNYATLSTKAFDSYMAPHNIFMEFYIYGGVIGLVMTLPYFWNTLLRSKNWSFEEDKVLLRFGFIILLLTTMMMHHVFFNKLFWVIMAVLVVSRDGSLKKL